MSRVRRRQSRLPFREAVPPEKVPKEAQKELIELLGQLLIDVVREEAELDEKENRHEREDQPPSA